MTMTLPTAKTKPTTDLAKQSILLYGVPKARQEFVRVTIP